MSTKQRADVKYSSAQKPFCVWFVERNEITADNSSWRTSGALKEHAAVCTTNHWQLLWKNCEYQCRFTCILLLCGSPLLSSEYCLQALLTACNNLHSKSRSACSEPERKTPSEPSAAAHESNECVDIYIFSHHLTCALCCLDSQKAAEDVNPGNPFRWNYRDCWTFVIQTRWAYC